MRLHTGAFMITSRYKSYISVSSDDDNLRYILGKEGKKYFIGCWA